MAHRAASTGRQGSSPRIFVDDVTPDTYYEVIRKGLEFIRFGDFVSADTKIFIKPNLTFPEYRPGVMTSPRCVEAAIVAVKDYTSHVYIGDSDSGGYNPFPMESVYAETGLVDFSQSHGVQLVNLSRLPRRTIDVKIGRRQVAVPLPRLLTDDIDLLLTMPVPKIHMNTQVSLTFKNQWGCIPEPSDRLRLHPDFAEVILAVNDAVRSRVAVVDGMYGLNGSGPMKGDPVELGWMLVADDIGAGARTCCQLMQIPVERARHLRLAQRRGLIPDASQLEVNRDLADFTRVPFVLHRRVTDYPGLLAFHSRPLSYLGYFSPLAGLLHKLLYLFREPFYDYDTGKALRESPSDEPRSQ